MRGARAERDGGGENAGGGGRDGSGPVGSGGALLRALGASLHKELLVSVRSWRLLAYFLFLAAVILLSTPLPLDSFPYEVALSQGPLVLLAALGCAFVFRVDSVSREHERGTAALLFGTPASRWVMIGAKALVPILVWLLSLAALSAAYLSQGLGEQFSVLWLSRLLSATLLFLAALSLLLLISAAVRGRGAPFAGLVAVLLIFFTSGYFPVQLAGGVTALSPGYHERLTTTDIMDGALDSPLPAAALALETVVFLALAGWAFRRSEVVR